MKIQAMLLLSFLSIHSTAHGMGKRHPAPSASEALPSHMLPTSVERPAALEALEKILPQVLYTNFAASFNFETPQLQGVMEGRMKMNPHDFDLRYEKLKKIGIGYRQYNVVWSEFENSDVPSSATPVTCPKDYTLVPKNEATRIAKGYHRYRCISEAALSKFDNLFLRDKQYGFQSGAILYSAPEQYRYPDCEGFTFSGNYIRDFCVPRDDAMDDFEDYVNLLASRYSDGGYGNLRHFIVWNENASDNWFDYSPIAEKDSESARSVELRIAKYAEMMKRVHAAVVRHTHSALIYASIDMAWTPGWEVGHMGSKTLLEGLWNKLGTSISWSVAVHPYSDPTVPPPPGKYNFYNLEMVSDFQAEHLRRMGAMNPALFPQAYMIASEQGMPSNGNNRSSQARFICTAHERAVHIPRLIAVAHNYFQSTEPQENEAGGASVQGAFYGLIPFHVPDSLDGMEKYDTGKAYISTSDPSLWGHSDEHFCCQVYKLGCKGSGPVYRPVRFPFKR